MTTGVKIVTLHVGDTVISLGDTDGFAPLGILFFGAHQGADFATRFFGAADAGLRQWSMSEYRKSGLTSSAGTLRGVCNRSDYCINMLSRSSGTIIVDAAAHLVSMGISQFTLAWDHNVSVGSWPITAVVFWGDQYTFRAGLAFAKSTVPIISGDDPFYRNITGFPPDLIIIGSSANVSFGTALPTSPTTQWWSVGWEALPVPAYVPPKSTLTGTVGSEPKQNHYVGATYWGASTHGVSGNNTTLHCGIAGTLGNFQLVSSQLSNGFGLAHTIAGANLPTSFGYVAIKWETGRFVTGSLAPQSGDTSRAFSRWGGTYNAGGTDTNPSGHADPSLVLFTLNNLRPEVSTIYSNSLSFCAVDIKGTATTYGGYAYGGGPNNGTYPYPTEENVAQLTSNMQLLPVTGTSPIVQATVDSWDADGVTLDFSATPIVSASFNWPYFAMTRDTGYLGDRIRLSKTERRDTFVGEVFSGRRDITLDTTEKPDKFAGSSFVRVTDGVTFAVTERPDRWVSSSHQGGMSTQPDGEFIYPEPEVRTILVPEEALLILQQSDADMVVDAEDRTILVPYEDRTIDVPPVEEGAWI